MMIEVPGDERDVEIARLADRLAVVEALEHRQQARVLLHGARERVEMARPGVARQRGPGGERLAGGGDRGVHVRPARLRDARQRRGRGRVDDVEPVAVLALGPAPADEQAERAAVSLQPLERGLIALGRGSIRHRLEDL